MFKIMIAMAVLVITASANATITAGHYLWESGTLPDSGEAFVSYRIWVDVGYSPGSPEEDDWWAAGLNADLTGGIFYQDPHGANPPNPAYFDSYPDLEYDSYYTSPGDYPNTDYYGAYAGGSFPPEDPWELDTDWFDTIDTGNGNFVIAQFTVLPTDPDWIVTGHVQYASRHSGSEIFDYFFTIPEPATLSLLGLGVLAIARRR